MDRYLGPRDSLLSGALTFRHLDAAKLVKHALALRTAVCRLTAGRRAAPPYLFAEPVTWGDGRPAATEAIERHRAEITTSCELVVGDGVEFLSLS